VHAPPPMRRRRFISAEFPPLPGDKVRVAAVLLFLFAGPAAQAQISGNASLVSDYRLRGVSLSQGNPEAQLDLQYDSPRGWYAGGFASGAKLYDVATQEYVAYGGYAARLPTGLSWEAGASSAFFENASRYNYSEAFVGLSSDNFSGRIYLSPHYFDQKNRTAYAELNATFSLLENLRFLAHAGLLHQFSNSDQTSDAAISRFDYRIGLNAKIADWNVQLSWVALQTKPTEYPHYEDRNPRATVLSVSYSF
jgi:uncharacterized protein (TIGR02001 family)